MPDVFDQIHAGGQKPGDVFDQIHATNQTPPSAPPSVGGFLSSIPKSAGNLLGNVAQVVAHPFKTFDALTETAGGAIQAATGGNLIPAKYTGMADAQGQINTFHNLVDHLKDRYGSLDNVKKTLYEDPIGALADLSTVFGGAGGALGVAGDVAKSGELARAAGIAGKVAEFTNPVSLPGKAIGAGMGTAGVDGASLAQRMYRSALKPAIGGAKVTDADLAAKVQTGLDAGIPVSATGLEKLQGLMHDVNQSIRSKVQGGAKAGATVDPQAVATRVDQIRPKFANQVNPEADVSALANSKEEFLRSRGMKPAQAPQPTGLLGPSGQPIMNAGTPATPAQPIPLDQAQALKQNTYAQLKGQYGQLSGAQIEAQKALARGLKEEIATQFPEIAELNAKDSQYIGLDGALEQAVKRIGNKDDLPLSTDVPTMLLKVLVNPAVKSRLALAMNMASKKNPGKFSANAASVGSRIDAYSNALGSANSNRQFTTMEDGKPVTYAETERGWSVYDHQH